VLELFNFLVYDFSLRGNFFWIVFVGSLPYLFWLFSSLLFFLFFSALFLSFSFSPLTFTDTFFTLDVYLGHGDAVRVVDPELGKLERENVDHETPHGISLNTPILGTTSTSTRRHTRRESSNPGECQILHLMCI
jgi:hypothetical protein